MDYSTNFVLLILCSKCIAVNIKRIEVPALVEMGTESVILNCDYGTETPGPGLVMKWFFNGSSGLVFQWIPPMQPQVIGLLKGKVDLTFRISGKCFRQHNSASWKSEFGFRRSAIFGDAFSLKISDEPLQAYRAIKILRPTTDLSGNYTCVVSTFMEEDRQTRSMLVYSRGKSFHFIQEKRYVFLVTLICYAENLYPRPVMTIYSQGNPLKQAVTEITMDSWGLYTVETKAVVHDDDVTIPKEEFVCELSLPPANYTANRTTVYYPGLMPTAHIASIEVEKPQERLASSSRRLMSHAMFVLNIHIHNIAFLLFLSY